MGIKLVRVQLKSGAITWGTLAANEVRIIKSAAKSLRELLQAGEYSDVDETISSENVSFLSPVTGEAQVICQGKNYLAHLLETGIKPKNKDFNLIFSKASSSIAPPVGMVHRPQRVKLLDYELELGLVIKTPVHSPANVTRDNLGEYVAGIVMANDISARDVQVPERQWFKGKSFRGFCPVGPVLYMLTKDEIPLLFNLDLRLAVNGETRQRANTKQLMHSPEDTLTELSEIVDLNPGDLILTGTPGGVAMRIQKNLWGGFVRKFSSEKTKMDKFLAEQYQSRRYLHPGDRITGTIRSPDGTIDLGRQDLLITG